MRQVGQFLHGGRIGVGNCLAAGQCAGERVRLVFRVRIQFLAGANGVGESHHLPVRGEHALVAKVQRFPAILAGPPRDGFDIDAGSVGNALVRRCSAFGQRAYRCPSRLGVGLNHDTALPPRAVNR